MKRYDPVKFNFAAPHFVLEETPTGEWVRWEDVEHLQGAHVQELQAAWRGRDDALAAERDRLRAALRNLVKANDDWNAAMMTIVGRPVENGWDDYLKTAREALVEVKP